MGLIDLTSDLAIGAGTNFSQQSGRHGGVEAGGLPVHSGTHTVNDDLIPMSNTPAKAGLDVQNSINTPDKTGATLGEVNYFSGLLGL
jgi:hypothetical protein